MTAIPAVHGNVVRVIDVPSQAISFLRVEVPIEHHAELTRLFYGKRVLVTLAGAAFEGLPYGLMNAAEPAPAPAEKPACWCETCRPIVAGDMRMVLCPECGNKRCPKANDHRNACTDSNDPGQTGSAYPAHTAAPAPDKPKGGAWSKWLALRCAEPEFQAWIYDAAPQRMVAALPDGTQPSGGATILARLLCGVQSRAEIDNDPEAEQRFRERILGPWSRHYQARHA